MSFATTAPLRRAIERLIPDRPFGIEFWDGTAVPGTREGVPYAETLKHWAKRLDHHREEAVRLVGEERVRVWRLYLRGARSAFETEFNSIYQVQSRLGS